MYITGPAIVKRGGKSFYFKNGLNVDVQTATFAVESDMHGTVDTGMKSRKVVISGRPAGLIRDLADLYPWGVADIGNSIFGTSDTALVIHTRAGQTISYPKSGLSKSPKLTPRATDTLFGDTMEWTCLGASAVAPTDAAHWKTIATTAFADITFDEDLLLRLRYTAAYGADPYDAITAQEGFAVDLEVGTEDIPDENVGIGDVIVKDLTAKATFVPSNLTEAQIDTLINLQGAAALLPGDSIAKGTEDLVIAGSNSLGGMSITLHNAGFGQSKYLYESGKLRAGEIQAMTRRTWSIGVADPLWTLAVS